MDINDEIAASGKVFLQVLKHGVPVTDPSEVFLAGYSPRYTEDGFELDANLVVNGGRNAIARLIGSGDSQWSISSMSWGTYDEAPRFDDLTLSPQATPGGPTAGSNEINLGSGVFKKAIGSVDFPQPFTVRFNAQMDYAEGNGNIVREAGLWCDNGTLFARKIFPGVRKSGDFQLNWSWLIRC